MPTGICDLNRFFGALALRVPDDPLGGDSFVFHSGVFSPLPTDLVTDRIVIRKLSHEYNFRYRADFLWMSISASKARELGVFLLACAFQGAVETTTLTLTHPESEIRRIVMRSCRPTLEDPPLGLTLVPFAFHYSPSEVEWHPWVRYVNKHDLPLLALSNAEEMVVTEEQWRDRDTVFEESSIPGRALLAELLLNAGRPGNQIREFDLEGDAGVRGVAPQSAELKIILPGSHAWIYDGDDVPPALAMEL